MGRFIVDRENSFSGVAAFYNIFLDGKKIGCINNAEVKEYIVSNGIHELYIQNGVISFGLKSNIVTFEVQDYLEVRVYCKSTMAKWSGIQLEVVSREIAPKPTDDMYDQLEKLNTLKKQGILSEEEFEAEKRKLLGGDM